VASGASSDPAAIHWAIVRLTSPISRHRAWHLLADAGLIAAAWILSFELRFDQGVPPYYQTLLERSLVLVICIKLAVFLLFGVYNRFWRYVSTRDLWVLVRAVVVSSLAADLTVYVAAPVATIRLPRSVAIMDLLLLLAFVTGSRLAARSFSERPAVGALVARGREVIVVGAGDAAQLVVRTMLNTQSLRYTPIGLVDDDPRKRNLRIHGVRVHGTIDELPRVLRDNTPDEVWIALPSASGELRRRIVDMTGELGVPVKTLPALHELLVADNNLAAQMRPVTVEDLLGRASVHVDLAAISSYLSGETVLVTGAGGSIGAELCRQIERTKPAKLVIFDQSEASLWEIERELADERGYTGVVPILGDIRNRARLREAFLQHRPGVVFHTAAYKHVPLMESNPMESVSNNVIGTKVVVETAVEFGTDRFVLISTDKALNPMAVYGQSKALCEWMVEAYGRRSNVHTRFVAVRFGNVLNSSGSVIPIFRDQIARGGPVTVTDPEMTRYFMTIPEAVALIIQAGAFGDRGHLFVLDMGEPVKILDLAKEMIRLSGKKPDEDIRIEITGARPGEKLHEELWGVGEKFEPTSHPAILRASRPPLDYGWLLDELAELELMAETGDTAEVLEKLRSIVSESGRMSSEVVSASDVPRPRPVTASAPAFSPGTSQPNP
jgi:FlaA1/EpsC-like NDP-sugar epimerase